MRSICKWVVLLLIGGLSFGCAHVISRDLRSQADATLLFQHVLQNPNAYKGKSVLWGGELIETMNQKDGSTLIEVFQRPLGWRGEPKQAGVSEGRFLALDSKYLDPYTFRKGRKVTIAGEISGEEVRPIGKMDYHYPLLSSKQIYLWEDYYYSGLYYRYYYAPWWGYPYGWGYPYWWGPPYGWRYYYWPY